MKKQKGVQQGEKPAKKGKKKWIVIAVVVVLFLAAAIGGNGGDNKQAESVAESQTGTDGKQSAEPEANTSAKVDALALEAKTAAGEITDEKRDEAVAFIVEHYPDYFADNETMEQAMSYGFLLEYAYSDDEAARTYAELGMDMSQAVKYVYRGAEAVEDDATQENLRQIQKALTELGYTVE